MDKSIPVGRGTMVEPHAADENPKLRQTGGGAVLDTAEAVQGGLADTHPDVDPSPETKAQEKTARKSRAESGSTAPSGA